MLIDFVQVRNDALLLFQMWDSPGNWERHQVSKEDTYTGQVSEGAQKRVRKAIDLLLQRNDWKRVYNPLRETWHDFRLNFVTLTLASYRPSHEETAYENLMKPFLRTCREKYGVKDYIWKAERQESGRIHWHLCTTEFIHCHEMERRWNQLQYKAGYLDQYARKYKSYSPPSTQVHAVENLQSSAAYLTKYMAKDDPTGDPIPGKVWDCNEELSRKRFSAELDGVTDDRIRKALRTGAAGRLDMEHCQIIHTQKPLELLSGPIYRNWQAAIRN
jgi:hypothetical protein